MVDGISWISCSVVLSVGAADAPLFLFLKSIFLILGIKADEPDRTGKLGSLALSALLLLGVVDGVS